MGTLLALESLRTFDDRVPPVHQRDHEHIHLQVVGRAVVGRRLVAERETEVVIDLVAERETEAVVVQLLTLDTVNGRLAAVVQGRIK